MRISIKAFEIAVRAKFGDAVSGVDFYRPEHKGPTVELFVRLVDRPTLRVKLAFDSHSQRLFISIIPPQRNLEGEVRLVPEELDTLMQQLKTVKEISDELDAIKYYEQKN